MCPEQRSLKPRRKRVAMVSTSNMYTSRKHMKHTTQMCRELLRAAVVKELQEDQTRTDQLESLPTTGWPGANSGPVIGEGNAHS